MPAIKYRVTLTDDEVEMLESLVRKGKSGARPQTRARILLKAASGIKEAAIGEAADRVVQLGYADSFSDETVRAERATSMTHNGCRGCRLLVCCGRAFGPVAILLNCVLTGAHGNGLPMTPQPLSSPCRRRSLS